MDPDPTERATFWSVVIGSGMLGLAQSGYEQTQIQRYCALPTVKKAKMYEHFALSCSYMYMLSM